MTGEILIGGISMERGDIVMHIQSHRIGWIINDTPFYSSWGEPHVSVMWLDGKTEYCPMANLRMHDESR